MQSGNADYKVTYNRSIVTQVDVRTHEELRQALKRYSIIGIYGDLALEVARRFDIKIRPHDKVDYCTLWIFRAVEQPRQGLFPEKFYQDILKDLVALTSKNYQFEVPVKLSPYEYRRFDALELSCPSIVRVYELKKDMVTLKDYHEKLYESKYIEAIDKLKPGSRNIELLFVSPNGEQKEAIQHREQNLSGTINNRQWQVKFVHFHSLIQPIVDEIFNKAYHAGGDAATRHLGRIVFSSISRKSAIPSPTSNFVID